MKGRWDYVPLKRVITAMTRGTAPNYVDDGPVRVIGQAANQTSGINWTRTRFHASDVGVSRLKGLLIPGDILVNSTGTGTLGRVGQYVGGPDGRPCIADGHITIVRANTEFAHPRFLYYTLSSQPFYDRIYAEMVVGATNQIELSTEKLSRAPIPLPPLEEQRRIADFLDAETARINQVLETRSRSADLLLERLDAVWGAEIASAGEKYGWIPIRRVLLSITDGPFGSALTSDHYSDEGARVIRLGNIGRAIFRSDDEAFVPIEYWRQLSRHHASSGDLIIAGLGDAGHPLGRACVLPDHLGPAMVKADCFRVRLDEGKVSHQFAAWALSSPPASERISLLSRGSTRARINLEVARDIPVPIPPLPVQAAIVTRLKQQYDKTTRTIKLINHQIDLLNEKRRALITAAVTGQFDVTTARGVDVS